MNKASAFVLTAASLLFLIMGMFPGTVMDFIADFGEGFMSPEKFTGSVSYFSAANLKGGLISIAIGLFLYFVPVRKWMMKKKDGSLVYVNRWNRYWDLENAVYRPLMLKILPMVFGVVCRIFDSLVDGLVVLLRKTVYKDSKLPHELEEGTYLTHVIGMEMDGFVHFMNHTFWKKIPRREGYEHRLALKHEEMQENSTIIRRSLSFGLLLFCAGLILTLVYLLWL